MNEIDDRKPHVMPEDEADQHILNMGCVCKPKLSEGIVVHWGFSVRRRKWLLSSLRSYASKFTVAIDKS